MGLHGRRHWVFDMDGTLTVPAHDFAAARRALGVPTGSDILAHIAALPAAAARDARRWLDRWERELAAEAQLQDDAHALVLALHARGARLGILTRNTVPVAHLTLEAVGLATYFPAAAVLGRDSAPAKPSPAGVRRLLSLWSAPPEDAVVVGDYLHDVRAGRAAGTATVLVNRRREIGWDGEADLVVGDLHALAAAVAGGGA